MVNLQQLGIIIQTVILGIGFAGAQSIFEQNPESYKDKKEVQVFLDLFKDIFDRLRFSQRDNPVSP